jgi:triosephosphate isomerase
LNGRQALRAGRFWTGYTRKLCINIHRGLVGPGLQSIPMSARRKLVAGNWKMNGTLAANAELLRAVRAGADTAACDLVICAPFPYLAQTADALLGSTMTWGAQDCSAHAQGAYTGEVSAVMLTDFGCRWVIVGHSERRQYHAESSALVAAKALQVLRAGLTPIVCVGETLGERDAGQTLAVVGVQLQAIVDALKEAGQAQWIARVVVAYEPVWAIGTGRTATSAQAQDVHAFIRQLWRGAFAGSADGLRILYGGSVKLGNAAELFAQPDVDGGLIGGASLKADEFLGIAAAAQAVA